MKKRRRREKPSRRDDIPAHLKLVFIIKESKIIYLFFRSFIDSIALKPPEDIKELKGLVKKKSDKQKEESPLQKKVKYF